MEIRPKYQTPIAERINTMPLGSVFTASDFLDIADTNTVNQSLFRLKREHKIRRLLNGIYDKPAYSKIINEYGAPRIDYLADALSRKFNWTIAPSGDTALNLLHISTQVPNAWEFVSDGPYREYKIDNIPLKFKHVMPREINGYSKITIMVIQGLRAIGKDNVSEEHIKRFSSILNPEDKQTLLNESKSKNASEWIYKNIQTICEETK